MSDMAAFHVDKVVCLGDVLGYGPDPGKCLDSVRKHVSVILMGNHDAAAAGVFPTTDFTDIALRSIEWTRRHLSDAGIAAISGFPLVHAESCFRCSHGGFARPGDFDYILTEDDAEESWESAAEPLLFTGHTHLPVVFVKFCDGTVCALPPQDFMMEPGLRYIVNPGSVGSPRDFDLRASYAVFDEETRSVVFRRVSYDFSEFREAVNISGLDPCEVPLLCGVAESDSPEGIFETAGAAAVKAETVSSDGCTVVRSRERTPVSGAASELPRAIVQSVSDTDSDSQTGSKDAGLFSNTVKISDIVIDTDAVQRRLVVIGCRNAAKESAAGKVNRPTHAGSSAMSVRSVKKVSGLRGHCGKSGAGDFLAGQRLRTGAGNRGKAVHGGASSRVPYRVGLAVCAAAVFSAVFPLMVRWGFEGDGRNARYIEKHMPGETPHMSDYGENENDAMYGEKPRSGPRAFEVKPEPEGSPEKGVSRESPARRQPDLPDKVYGYRTPKPGDDGNRLAQIYGSDARGLGDYRLTLPDGAGAAYGYIGNSLAAGLTLISGEPGTAVWVDTPFLKFGKDNSVEVMARVLPFDGSASAGGRLSLQIRLRDEKSGEIHVMRSVEFKPEGLPANVAEPDCFSGKSPAEGWQTAYALFPSPGSSKTVGLRFEGLFDGRVAIGGFVMRRREK